MIQCIGHQLNFRMTAVLAKIVSGGQTGVDRGALDAALEAEFPAGGWCPVARAAEDGPIPDLYPLQVLSNGGYRERTLRNVLDSDATVILAPGRLTGGTALTRDFCSQHSKVVLVVDALQLTPQEVAGLLAAFLEQHQVRTLNVAGPRESHWPDGCQYSHDTIKVLLGRKQ
jgi:hypothetical protein